MTLSLASLPGVIARTLLLEDDLHKDDWLAARERGVGSSDAAGLVGASAWSSPLSIWEDKTGRGMPVEDNQYMEAGRYLEPVIAQWFADKTGFETYRVGTGPGECAILVNRDRPWERCTPDGLVRTPEHGISLLEIKTAAGWKADDWEDGVPLAYEVQVQHQLMVTGLTHAFVAVLIGGNDFRWFEVIRSPTFISTLRDIEEVFWGHVKDDTPPPASAAMDYAIVQNLNADVNPDEMVALDGIFITHDEELEELKNKIKLSEERVKVLKAKIAEAIGRAVVGVLPNGVSYTNKVQTRKESIRVIKGSTTRVLRRKKAQRTQ